jgi:hypothetical protein
MAALAMQCARLDDPGRVVTLEATVLAAARVRSHAILCTYELPGDVLALGRYHLVPPPQPDPIAMLRRLGGGRVAPLGAGYVGIVLAVPHGASLLHDDPVDLAPERVLNRAVRGLLGGLESLGVPAYYPGRDRVTVERRVIASLGLEAATDGAVLVEMCLAVTRSFADVSSFADRADPAGLVPIELMLPEQGTAILAEAGRAPDLDEVTAALAIGYAGRLGLEVTDLDGLPPCPADRAWLEAGRLAAHLDRHATARDLLGVIEVYAARDGRHVGDVRVCGDLIAPSGTVARLEAAFRGAPIDREALRTRAVAAVEGAGESLLGVRSVATIGDLVYTACAA